MFSQEVSSRTTPTDSKYGLSSSYSGFHCTDLVQLYQTKTDNAAPEYYGPALAIAFSNRHVLLGTRELEFIGS